MATLKIGTTVRTFTCMVCQDPISSLGSYVKEGSDYTHVGCHDDRVIESHQKVVAEAKRTADELARKQREMEAEAKRKAEQDAQAERTERARLQQVADARARASLPPIPAGMVNVGIPASKPAPAEAPKPEAKDRFTLIELE